MPQNLECKNNILCMATVTTLSLHTNTTRDPLTASEYCASGSGIITPFYRSEHSASEWPKAAKLNKDPVSLHCSVWPLCSLALSIPAS